MLAAPVRFILIFILILILTCHAGAKRRQVLTLPREKTFNAKTPRPQGARIPKAELGSGGSPPAGWHRRPACPERRPAARNGAMRPIVFERLFSWPISAPFRWAGGPTGRASCPCHPFPFRSAGEYFGSILAGHHVKRFKIQNSKLKKREPEQESARRGPGPTDGKNGTDGNEPGREAGVPDTYLRLMSFRWSRSRRLL